LNALQGSFNKINIKRQVSVLFSPEMKNTLSSYCKEKHRMNGNLVTSFATMNEKNLRFSVYLPSFVF